MNIIINGESKTIAENTSAADLINDLGLAQKKLALEVNHDVVPRSEFESFRFNPGDQVEIVHAIGGG